MSAHIIWCLHDDCVYSSYKTFKSEYGLACHMKDVHDIIEPIKTIKTIQNTILKLDIVINNKIDNNV
jgi:hypothetical protein